jgi:sulfite exporter TauE/SafE/copper chaperone CopZ
MNNEIKNSEELVKCEYKVKGMHCAACELLVEKKLSKIENIHKVDASLTTGQVEFSIPKDTDKSALIETINETLKESGYEIIDESSSDSSAKESKSEKQFRTILTATVIALGIFAIYFLLQKVAFTSILQEQDSIYVFAFIYGLVASVSSCMAVVGSVVLSLSASYSKSSEKRIPLTLFHISRIVTFIILGGVLGLIGSLFTLNQYAYLLINTVLFVVMIIMGLSITELFPSLNKFQIRLPKQLTRSVISKDQYSQMFIFPILLGAVTFFLPCGFTQSMQFEAMASGTFLQGAMLLGLFSLGTLPALSLISFSAVKLSEGKYKKLFFMTSGILVVIFASYTYYVFVANTILPIFY